MRSRIFDFLIASSSHQNGLDHSFDHLRLRTTWKQCEREHPKASFSDTKAPKSPRNQGKNRCRFVWELDAAGSSPVTSTKFGFGKQFPKPFSLLPPTQILRADRFGQPSLLFFFLPLSLSLIALKMAFDASAAFSNSVTAVSRQ